MNENEFLTNFDFLMNVEFEIFIISMQIIANIWSYVVRTFKSKFSYINNVLNWILRSKMFKKQSMFSTFRNETKRFNVHFSHISQKLNAYWSWIKYQCLLLCLNQHSNHTWISCYVWTNISNIWIRNQKKICFSHIDKIIEHDIRAIIVNMNRKQIKNKFNVHSLCVFRI